MDDVVAVVATHNAMPWIEQCLASLDGTSTVVVDNGSTDDTVSFVRDRFPAVHVVEQENLGLAAGWKRGLEESSPSRWALILNADAWLVGDALERLVAVGDAHPRVAVVAPKLLNLDGSLQRSVRGFPTLWRLATEYLYLRKLGPRTELLNAFYGAGFDHASEREVECVMGACMLVRRAAIERGRASGSGLLPVQRGGRLALPVRAGRLADALHARRRPASTSAVRPTAAVSTARTSAASFASSPSTTATPRRSASRSLLRVSLALRGRIIRGSAGRDVSRRRPLARDGRRPLADRAMSSLFLLLRLAAATGLVLAPGAILARAVGVRSTSATLAWGLGARLRCMGVVFLVHASLTLALVLLLVTALCAAPLRPPASRRAGASRAASRCGAPAHCSACSSGTSPGRSAVTGSSTSRVSASSSSSATSPSRP